MKNALLVMLFILTAQHSVRAQNIVPNYSFEQADSCPVKLNASSYKYSLGCVGWGQANAGSTDYYYACDTAALSIGRTSPWVGVPLNSQGYQKAYEGNAYMGIIMYDSIIKWWKEYLITNIPALEIDTAYKVTIHVALANISRFATDGLGVLFTTYGSPNQYMSTTILTSPQVDYTSYGIINDTSDWTTLTGVFVADSAYTNLIIGGFLNATEMHITEFNIAAPRTAYYYIDNVIVEKLSSTGIARENLANGAYVYPNPMNDYAIIHFNNQSGQTYNLIVFNAQGQIVQRVTESMTNEIAIKRNDLPSGFYYYQLQSGNGIEAIGKLIIK